MAEAAINYGSHAAEETPIDYGSHAPEAEEQPDALEQIGTSLKNQAKGLFDLIRVPVNRAIAERIGQGIVDSHVEQWHKAHAAYEKGDYASALHHGLGAAVPLVGPLIEQTAEKATTGGRPWEAATDILAAPLAGKLIPKVPAAAARTLEIAKNPAVQAAAGIGATAMGYPEIGSALGAGSAIGTLRRILGAAQPEIEAAPSTMRPPSPLETFIDESKVIGRATGEMLPPSRTPGPVRPPLAEKPAVVETTKPAPKAAAKPAAPIEESAVEELAAEIEPHVPIVPHDPMPIRLADAEFKRGLSAPKAEPEPAPVAEAPKRLTPIAVDPKAPVPKAYLNQETTGLQNPIEQHYRTELSRKVAQKLVKEGFRAKDLMDMRRTDPEAYSALLDKSAEFISKQAKKGKEYSPSEVTQERIVTEMRKIQPRRRLQSAGSLMEMLK